MREIVIDKSFLDGAPRSQIRELFSTHKAFVIESLFFELMTTDVKSKVRCFSKLPEQPHSFALIPNIGTLLRFGECQASCRLKG